MYTSQSIRRIFCLLTFAVALGCMPLKAQTDSLATSKQTAEQVSESTPQPTVAATLPNQAPEVLWDRANTAYINSDFHTAIEVYEQILAQGLASSKLYYNLGNAYFKEGNLGKSILFYQRALRLTPGNEDVRYNLEQAQSRTKDTIGQIPEFFAITWLRALRHTMGCTWWSLFSLAMLATALGFLLFYLLAQRLTLRKVGFYGTLIALFMCATTTWFAVLERREILRDDEAILTIASTAVKSSPSHTATDLFVLHEGTKLTITDRLEGWAEIVIADGKKGWIEVRKMEVI